MSYYKLKSVKFDKKNGKIILKVADSSLRPLSYFESDFGGKDMTFEQKIEYFFVDMLQGNIQGGTGKVKGVYQTLSSLVKLSPETSFEKDMKYAVGRCNGLEHLVSKIVGVPMILNQDIDMEDVKRRLDAYEEESEEIYQQKIDEYREKGWLITHSCARSDVFPGHNVFVCPDEDELIIAENACYMPNHLGFCDTTKGKVYHLGKGTTHLFHILSYGATRQLTEAIPDETQRKAYMDYVDGIIEKLGDIEMGKLPYPEYVKKVVA